MHVLTSILHVLLSVYYTENHIIVYQSMQLKGRIIKVHPLKMMENLYSVVGNV